MYIREAVPADTDIILNLYERARVFMAAHGNPSQWGNTYPPQSLVTEDIRKNHSYVCIEHEHIIATFYYCFGEDDTYKHIYSGNWLNDAPYGAVHRITSDGTVKGAASFCLDWAFRQCGNLKIDTHRENLVMQKLLQKNHFVSCGIIYLPDGSERLAYQKTSAGY